jgi:putative spermidine/putrescine transport system permease protein
MHLRKKKLQKDRNIQTSLFNRITSYIIYCYLILPSLIVIPMSFSSKDEFEFPPEKLSLYLYKKFFSDQGWLDSALQSLLVAGGTVLLSLLLGVTAAYGLVRGRFPGAKFLTIIFISPMLVPLIVISLGLYLYLSSLGLSGTTFGLIIGHTLIATPFVIVTSMSGLRQINENLEIAAQIIGAGRLVTFWKVTLPLLRPSIYAGGLFAFLISFDEVVIAWLITNQQTLTLPVKMYSTIRWEISPVLAAVSTLLTLVSVLICLLVAAIQKK